MTNSLTAAPSGMTEEDRLVVAYCRSFYTESEYVKTLIAIIDRLSAAPPPASADVRNEALEEAARAIDADPESSGSRLIRALKPSTAPVAGQMVEREALEALLEKPLKVGELHGNGPTVGMYEVLPKHLQKPLIDALIASGIFVPVPEEQALAMCAHQAMVKHQMDLTSGKRGPFHMVQTYIARAVLALLHPAPPTDGDK